MTFTYRDPFSLIEDLFFGNLSVLNTKLPGMYLPYNLEENKKDGTAKLTMAVAGYPKDYISVSLSDGQLKIEGKNPFKSTESSEAVKIYTGLSFRDFTFSWPVPQVFFVESITLENGILEVNFKRNVTKPKLLEIKSK